MALCDIAEIIQYYIVSSSCSLDAAALHSACTTAPS